MTPSGFTTNRVLVVPCNSIVTDPVSLIVNLGALMAACSWSPHEVRQLHGEDRTLDEQQQTEVECWQNAGDMDRIQTTACQSRHQGVPAAVLSANILFFHHSVQSRCLSRQSAHHAGSCGGNVPLVLLPAEAAADYSKFIDDGCRAGGWHRRL